MLRMRRKSDVSTLRYARSFERLQLRTSGFKPCKSQTKNIIFQFCQIKKKYKKNPTDRPITKTMGWVTANKISIKDGLIIRQPLYPLDIYKTHFWHKIEHSKYMYYRKIILLDRLWQTFFYLKIVDNILVTIKAKPT